MNHSPIIIVDDDSDERELLLAAWKELGFNNQIIFFDDGKKVLDYLKTKKIHPFLILCDVNIPRMDGFELRMKLLEDENLNYKTIPFIFWSTAASQAQIKKSYDLSGHGFFIKDTNFKDLKQSLIEIVSYWTKSQTPQ